MGSTLFHDRVVARPLPVLHLVIAEAAIEPVPQALWSHPSVSKNAKARGKRPGQLLLDDTYHHTAMRQAARKGHFDDIERRGRPDILHTTLLVALESRLNKEGRLRVWVHTRNDELVTIIPQLRMQRAQHRFYGLLEQLFEHGAVPPDGRADVLLSLEPSASLGEAIRRTEAATVYVMDEQGANEPLEPLFAASRDTTNTKGDTAVVVGGFPTGRLQSDLGDIDHRRIALGTEPLTAWAVVTDLVTRYRLATGGN